jgi:hypothetical protein
LSSPKSEGHIAGFVAMNARVIKANDVVIKAMKHPQNIN